MVEGGRGLRRRGVLGAVAAVSRERLRLRGRRGATPWAALAIFLGPNLVLFLAFMVIPFFFGLGLSLVRWDVVEPPTFAGIGNYLELLHDPLLGKLVWNTVYFMGASTAVLMVVALLCALLLNQRVPMIWLWRAVFFLPLITSPVAAAAVWKWMYAKDYGLVDVIITHLGFKSIDWVYNTKWALPALIVMFIWRQLPLSTILYLAGLQAIPHEFYEAAAVDGAGRLRTLWHVTVPLLTPTMFFVLVTTVVHLVFGSFDVISVMTQGGPLNATNTFIWDIWQNAFQNFKMGFASAEAYFIFVVVFALTAVNFWVQRWWVRY
jgi:multiple sugar transport system permease protein